ncbi:MAG: hypothetical protein IPH16_02890 [Haliscomenobacter sp.]|nr:hypothetical protein [Haliscomenobacter sp.]MBK7475274.1 hypothetical protein [Haliscomenobacter sp.]MBK8879814.1 hypothetical protein [Haliscomenobacter sp.]
MRAGIVRFLLAAVAGLGHAAALGQYQAEALLDSTSILIGDQVQFRVKMTLPASARLLKIGVDTLKQVPGLERLKASPIDSFLSNNAVHYEQSFVLTAFDSGYYRLPPIPVELLDKGQVRQVLTNDLALRVRTIPVQPDSTQLQPIKDIIREPLKVRDFWQLGAGVAVLFLLYWIWYRFLRKNRSSAQPETTLAPSRAPEEVALEKLEELKASGLLERGEFKAYQSELTYLFKEYLSNRFECNALEATTDEILDLLPGLGLSYDWSEVLSALLRKADLVKFAKATLSYGDHEQAWETVYRLVMETRNKEEVAEEADLKEMETNDSE